MHLLGKPPDTKRKRRRKRKRKEERKYKGLYSLSNKEEFKKKKKGWLDSIWKGHRLAKKNYV